MTTLARIYDNKAKTETNITTRKTYLLGVDELYIEPGYNVREIDQTHVEEFRDAFIAGEHVPPLTRSAAMPQFSATKARRLVELLCDARYMGVVDGEAVLYHDDKYTAEVRSILNEYRDANERNGEGE